MLKRHEYETREALAEALSAGVAAVLAGGIATRGQAVLAVSGGSTPKLFFRHLAQQAAIDWPCVTVVLVDERWVPETSERSNARLVRENLLQGPAAAARTSFFYREGKSAEDAEEDLSREFAVLGPIDVAILGLGEDGHTASFFPGGDRLAEAIDLGNPAAAVPMRAPGADEPRVTLTLSRLADARLLAIHIEGENKRLTLDRAQAGSDPAEMPVRAVLALQREQPVELFFAP